MSKTEQDNNTDFIARYTIRNVHKSIPKIVRLHAVQNGISVGDALKELVELGQAVVEGKRK